MVVAGDASGDDVPAPQHGIRQSGEALSRNRRLAINQLWQDVCCVGDISPKRGVATACFSAAGRNQLPKDALCVDDMTRAPKIVQ